MEISNEIIINQQKYEQEQIRPPQINQLDSSFISIKIIDGIYSIVDDNYPIKKDYSQYLFWDDSWQSGEKKVDEYISEGKIEEFPSMDDFLKSLLE